MKNQIIFTIIIMLFSGMYIPGIHMPVYTLIIGITLCLLIIAIPKKFASLINFYKYKFFKVLLLYILWVCFAGFLLVIFGKYNFWYYLYAVYLLFLYGNFTWYIFPYIVCPRYIPLKFLAKFLVIFTYIICVYGLIEYFLHCLHIDILEPVQKIIVNRRLMEMDHDMYADLNRVYSIFEEPSYLGGFICITLPIIYNIIFSKFKIIKNKNLNFIIKKTYFPILFLTIVFIQSPIWFIVFLISTGIYFKKTILMHTKKIILLSFIVSIGFVISLQLNFDFSSTFLSRITNTAESLSDIELLVYKERSLATRVVCYVTRFKIFLKNPIIGVGYRNATPTADNIFWSYSFRGSHFYKRIHERSSNPLKQKEINGAIFWTSLSDTGIIGFILFYAFLILSIKNLNTIQRKIDDSIEKSFIIGLKNSYISIICLSFYDLRSNNVYFWFLFGLTLSVISYYNYIKSEKLLLSVDNNKTFKD